MPLDDFSVGPSQKTRAVFRASSEQFRLNGKALPYDVGSFWRWALSDLNSNTARGLVAEFIVAQALGCVDTCREEWCPYDRLTKNGVRVEVKAAAYRQTWAQRKASPIRFQIGPTRAWNAEAGTFAKSIERQSDLYVFCLLENKIPSPDDPLNLDRWSFYPLATAELNRKCPAQRSISLARLIHFGARKYDFSGLKDAVARIAASVGANPSSK